MDRYYLKYYLKYQSSALLNRVGSKKESEKSINGKEMAHPGHKGSTSDINSEKVIEFSRKVANGDSDV